MNQVGIDEFLRALRCVGVKKDDLNGEQLKSKYSNVARHSIHQFLSTPTKYENENKNNNKKITAAKLYASLSLRQKYIIIKIATERERLCSQATLAQA